MLVCTVKCLQVFFSSWSEKSRQGIIHGMVWTFGLLTLGILQMPALHRKPIPMHAEKRSKVWPPHARTEPPWLDACQHHPPDQLWCITRGTWPSEKPADLPCLDELQHFQAHTGHRFEGLNSQPAVYQCSGTGNQFSNAVWAYSLQLWSTPHCADTDVNTHIDEALSAKTKPTTNITQIAIAKAEDNSQILTYQVKQW